MEKIDNLLNKEKEKKKKKKSLDQLFEVKNKKCPKGHKVCKCKKKTKSKY